MKCAETRLQQISPQSHVLRTEAAPLTKTMMEPEEWTKVAKEITDWSGEMKTREKALEETNTMLQPTAELPAIRKIKNIAENPVSSTQQKTKVKSTMPRTYDEWEKFDADKEILKMELEDERKREEQVAKKKKQHEKEKKEKKKEKTNTVAASSNFSAAEKEFMATQEKDRGNECYRAGEFEDAVQHYSSSVSLFPTPAAYNNRAMAYLKLNKYGAALADCNQVLEAEPLNVKALMRRGTAHQNKANYEQAFEDFSKVVELEPDNRLAKSCAEQMRKQRDSSLRSVRMTINDEPESDGFVFPKPRPNIPLNEWGLAKVMCRCNGTPSWAYKKPPKCKVCQRKRVERRAKREEERQKMNQLSEECAMTGEECGENEDTDFMQTDEKGAGDMIATEKVSEDTKNIFPDPENLNQQQQEIDKESGNTERNEDEVPLNHLKSSSENMNNSGFVTNEVEKNDFKLNENNEETFPDSDQNSLIASDNKISEVQDGEMPKTFTDNSFIDSNKDDTSIGSCSKELHAPKQMEAGRTKEKSSSGAVKSHNTKEVLIDSSGVKRKVTVASKYVKNARTAQEEASEQTRQSNVPLEDISITSPFEFVRVWQALRVDSDPSAYAQVLQSIPPSNLQAVVGNKLDGPMLSTILTCLCTYYTCFTPEQALEYLNSIISLPRFNIVKLFLEASEKRAVCQLLKKLEDQGLHPSGALWKAFT